MECEVPSAHVGGVAVNLSVCCGIKPIPNEVLVGVRFLARWPITHQANS